MHRISLILAAGLGLAACEGVDFDNPFAQTFGVEVNRADVIAASSALDLEDLGGFALTGEEIEANLSGTRLVEEDQFWSWDIRSDGTHGAQADNLEWADVPGQWQIASGQFCRENEDLALKCSDVYKIGPYYRFTEPDGSLAPWTVALGGPAQ